jgi:hypothetical protein
MAAGSLRKNCDKSEIRKNQEKISDSLGARFAQIQTNAPPPPPPPPPPRYSAPSPGQINLSQ